MIKRVPVDFGRVRLEDLVIKSGSMKELYLVSLDGEDFLTLKINQYTAILGRDRKPFPEAVTDGDQINVIIDNDGDVALAVQVVARGVSSL